MKHLSLDRLRALGEAVRANDPKSLEALVERFSASEPEVDPELWKRCAAAVRFDRQTYEEVLITGLDSVPFDALSRRSEVERLPGVTTAYRSKKPMEASWTSKDKERLSVLDGRLAEHLESRGLSSEAAVTQHLRHLLVSDPERAEKVFLRLYDKAAKRFDLPRCDTLLRILHSRQHWLERRLIRLWGEKRNTYRIRSLFAEDYRRTVRVLKRTELTKRFERWLSEDAPQGRWIFQIYAGGGLGKTTFLRWLIARRLVPELEIPVARIDFDNLHLPSLSRSPWLILLPLVEQLNDQLSSSSLAGQRHRLGELAAVLDRPAGEGGRRIPDIEDRLTARGGDEARRIRRDLSSALRAGERPVLVVLDTFEEPFLHAPQTLDRVLGELRKLREMAPELHLVLSGRYDLTNPKRSPGLSELDAETVRQLLDDSTTYNLLAFSDDEAERYLRNVRGLPEDRLDANLLNAMVRKARQRRERGTDSAARRAHPLRLSLLAELVLANRNLTAEDVATLPVEIAHLIERVVLRIPERTVRWTVRYGSVARRLDSDFLEILAPYLRDDAARARLDPIGDLPAGVESYSEEIRKAWAPPEEHDTAFDLETLWSNLRRYASNCGWLETDPKDPERLRFQPEVVRPLRELLAGQEIFAVLHEAASDFFQRRAEMESERWGDWTAEALYHGFQAAAARRARGEDPAADPDAAWHATMEDPRAWRLGTREDLCRLVIGQDLLDDQRQPRQLRGVTLVQTSTVAAAHTERMRVVLSRAAIGKLGVEDALSSAKRHATQAEELGGTVPAVCNTLHQGLRQLRAGEAVETAEDLEKELERYPKGAEASTTDRRDRLALLLLRAWAFEAANDRALTNCLLEALRIAEGLEHPLQAPIDLHLRLTRSYRKHDDLEMAHLHATAAFEQAEAGTDPTDLRHALIDLVRVERQSGRPEAVAEATERASRSASSDLKLRFAIESQQVRVALEAEDPSRASEHFERARSLAQTPFLRALFDSLSGSVRAEHLRPRAAEQSLESSAQNWSTEGNHVRAASNKLATAQLHANLTGNLGEASQILRRNFKAWETDPGLKLGAELLLLRVRQGQGEDITAAALEIFSEALSNNTAHAIEALASLCTLGLIQDTGMPQELFGALLDFLRRVEPASARLPLLEVFRHGRAGALEPEKARRLLEVATGEGTVDLEGSGENALQAAAVAAEICRVGSLQERGVQLLRHRLQARAKQAGEGHLARLLRVAQAIDRFVRPDGLDPVDPRPGAPSYAMFPELCDLFEPELLARNFGEFPDLFAATHLECAERLLGGAAELATPASAWDSLQIVERRLNEPECELRGTLWEARYYLALDLLGSADSGAHRRGVQIVEKLQNLAFLRAFDIDAREPHSGPDSSFSVSTDGFVSSGRQSGQRNVPGVTAPSPEHSGEDPGEPESSQPPSALPEERPSAPFRLRLYRDGSTLQVETLGAEDQLLASGVAASPLLSLSPDEIAGALDESPLDALMELGNVLPGPDLVGPGGIHLEADLRHLTDSTERPQLELGIDPAESLVGLPWELSRPFSDRTEEPADATLASYFEVFRTVPSSNAPSLASPEPADAGAERSGRVLIIQRDMGFEIQMQHGYSVLGGGVLEGLYSQTALEVETLQEADPNTLAGYASKLLPDVLHLAFGFQEDTSSGDVYIEIGDGRAQSWLTSSSVSSLLTGWPAERRPPLVLLDAPWPGDIHQAWQQLMWRNRFAAGLLAGYNVCGVLGCGLGEIKSLEALGRAITGALGAGSTLGELATAVRNAAPQISGPYHPSAAVALFTFEPSQPSIPQGAP